MALRKLFVSALVLVAIGGVCWSVLDRDWRALIATAPTNTDILFWNDEQRAAGFRMLDRLDWVVSSRTIAANGEVLPLPAGEDISPITNLDIDAFMESQQAAAIVIVHDGNIVLERYGLGFDASGRWTSFSVAKSLTSTLVGAAIEDGHITSLDDRVTQYIAELRGSAYDDVTVRQLLTMSSGVRWNEDYGDPQSDVALFNEHEPDGGLDVTVSYMRGLERDAPPGEQWNYKTGETNLIGVLVSEATGKTVSAYLSEKIWTPFGMEQDATWLLNSSDHEISGCCIQAATRDMARFGLFVLADGVADGGRVVPEGWFSLATSSLYETNRARRGYGLQWWTFDDGTFMAGGIFGQGIFIDPARKLVIASNANWPTASDDTGKGLERYEFYRAVQNAIDVRSAQQSETADADQVR